VNVDEELNEALQGAGRAGRVSGTELVEEQPAQDGDEQGRLGGIGAGGPGAENAGELG
jgi:hypothetical protein